MHDNVIATDARAILEDIALCGHRTGTKIIFPTDLVGFIMGNNPFPGWDNAVFLIPEDANIDLFQECLHSRDLFFSSEILRVKKEVRISDVLTNDFRGKIRLVRDGETEHDLFSIAVRVKPFGNELAVWIKK